MVGHNAPAGRRENVPDKENVHPRITTLTRTESVAGTFCYGQVYVPSNIACPATRRALRPTRRVDECGTLDELFTHCLPAFGGAYLRRIYQILDQAIGMGCPLTLAISGPVTVSGQHQTWLIPLLETGWVAYLSTTDAVCYHDGHRSLDAYKSGPIHEVSDLQRRRRAARRGHHPRHRHGLRRRRAARPGPLPHRRAGAPRIPAQDDRHRTALPAGPLLRRAGGAERRRARACSPPAIGARFRSSWARPATAASS